MDEEWGINDPVVGEDDSETWGENDPVVEDTQEDWGANDPVIGEAEEDAPTAPSILEQYDEAAKGYKERSTALQSAMEGYQALAESPERTPEQEAEMTNQWQSLIRSQAQLSKDASKLRELQPAYDQYFADQKQARIDYIEDRRGSGVFGDEGANALYELDARAEQEYEAARAIEDDQKRKEAVAAIQAKYQTEEKTLNNQFIERFKEGETKINNAADVIGQAFAKGQALDQFLFETSSQNEEYAELQESFMNQDDPEKGKLFREAMAMHELASGKRRKEGPADTWKFRTMGDDGTTEAARVGIINNEIRVSPLHVWDAEGIKAEIEALDISDAKKQKTIASIPQLQEEAAKVEFPFLQQVKEFNNFVKENNLENVSPKRQIAEWKSREEGWLSYVGKAFPQIGLGLTTGTLGLLEAGQAIVGATALTMGAQNFADPFLDAATKTSDEIERLTRISQEIGGPTLAAELAAVVPQIVTQIGFGGAVAFGGRKIGLKPKTVSNIGFGSSVGVAFAQSYGGVLSSAFQQLEKEKIDGGMDPIQARAEAVKEAQLPAALSGLSTAIVTTLGGKRGAEAVFRQGADGIKAKLNTAAFRAELDAFIPNVIKGFRNEGYEEFADQLAQGIIEQFTFNPELATSDIINNAFKALVIGGIAGGTVEGLKYGYDYMRAPSQMARRKESMASLGQSISDVEKEISEAAASSPIGVEFQREYDVTQPSDEAANLGARSVDRTRMTELQEERKQLTELLEDETISRVARNQLEAKLAAADFEYYNEILVPSRINVVNEQIVDQLDAMAVTQQTKDSVTALTKIANGLGAESLTGRERVAVGITSIGEGRFLPSRKNPMIEVTDQGVAKVTEAGRLMAENIGMVPLVRMIGLSETTQAKRAEMQRMAEQVAAQKAQTEAKEAAESDEAKRYGPESAEALKRQAEAQPPAGDKDAQARIAQLLKEQEEAQRKAVEALQKKEAPAEPQPAAEVAPTEPVAPTTTVPLDDLLQADTREEINRLTSEGMTREEAIADLKRRRIEQKQSISDSVNVGDEIVVTTNAQTGATRRFKIVKAGEGKAIQELNEQGGSIGPELSLDPNAGISGHGFIAGGQIVRPAAAPAVTPPAEVTPTPETPNLEPLRRVARAEQTLEDVKALSDAGLVEIYKDQPVITEAGIAALPEAERPRLSPEARKIQIDTGANAVVAEAISKNLRIGVDQVGPNVKMPEGWTLDGDIYVPPQKQEVVKAEEPPVAPPVQPPVAPPTAPPVAPPPTAGALTEEQASQVVKDAQEARAKGKPVDVKGSTQYGPRSIEPKQVIGKTAREALLAVSRLNLSKIAQSDPNEIMMQDVAAILAELNMPILDTEQVVTLSSIRRRGRARRRRGVGIAMPTTFNTPVELFVHEAGHTLTADEIAKYAPRNITGKGKAYLEAINKAIADANTPDPVKRLFTLYVSTMDQLGITEQYFGDTGIAGTLEADKSASSARRLQAQGRLRKDLNWVQLYGLANIEEFVSQTFSEPDFRNLLKTLKDPTQPSRTLWSAFVEAIQRILQLPKGSMAAGVIEASVDIGMITAPSRAAGRAAPTPVTEGDMAPEGEPEEGKTVEMSLEMEKERTFQLLGERLYTAELPKVVVKETTQNAFDAIKDAEETGEIPRGGGVIAYSRKELDVNGEKIVRMMFSDNGGGMTPEILQNAFFTVGGTFKRSGKGSGGFGLAKLGMFMSADRVMVETVRDGVVTTADLSKQELVDKRFNVNVAEDPNRKNGTMVVLEFKKEITRSDGKTVQFSNPYTQFDKLIYHNVAVIDDSYGTYQEELIKLFQNKPSLYTIDELKSRNPINPYTFESFVKEVPNVETFEQDFVIAGAKKPIKVRVAAARLGYKRKNGKAKWNEEIEIAGVNRTLSNYNMSVLSNGLFQFEQTGLKLDPMKLFGSEPLPYSIIVDIDAGGLDAASVAYPFTNSREDFQNGVVKDYVNKLLNDIRVKERQRQFDQEFGLLTDISGGKPRKESPTLYNNTTIVPEPSEQKFLEDLTQAVFNVADDLVVALRKGKEDGILEDAWYKVKSQKGSVSPTGRAEEDSLDYFYGVGISKNWGGVNTSREPVSALVNPIYEERADEYAKTEFGRRILARTIAKTLIHEINHHLHRNEGADFTFFILQNEAYLGEVGAIQSAVDKILPIVNQHSDAIISLKSKFRTAETKDTDNELTGEQYERSSKEPDGQPRTTVVGGDRVVQQPSAEVSPRPTSEEDGEQTGAYLPSSLTVADRQDAGVGEGISFGEALSGSLVENQAQINEGGITRAEAVESVPEEEFEGDFAPEPEAAPFYSQLERVVDAKMPNVSSPQQIKAIIDPSKGSGIKPEEIKWSGINDAIDRIASENNGKVPKDQLLRYIQDEGTMQFEEVRFQDIVGGEDVIVSVDTTNWRVGDPIETKDGREWVIRGRISEDSDLYEWKILADTKDEAIGIAKTEAEELLKNLSVRSRGGRPARYNDPKLVLPNGKNYREVVLTTPIQDLRVEDLQRPEANNLGVYYYGSSVFTVDLLEMAEGVGEYQVSVNNRFLGNAVMAKSPEEAIVKAVRTRPLKGYTSSHFPDTPNYVAHYRATDRQDGQGRDGTLVEEFQSDLHQQGRKYGYEGDFFPNEIINVLSPRELTDIILEAEPQKIFDIDTALIGDLQSIVREYIQPENRETIRGQERYDIVTRRLKQVARREGMQAVSDAPFRKDWGLQLFKRALVDAVSSGKQWIGWTVGETQNERYDLSRQINMASAIANADGTFNLVIEGKDGQEIAPYARSGKKVTEKELEDTVGKDVAAKLIEGANARRGAPWPQGVKENPAFFALRGLDLKIGGKGMKGFYDEMLPKEIGKYVKKWGATVEKDLLPITISPSDGSGLYTVRDADGNVVSRNITTVQEALRIAERNNGDYELEGVASVEYWKVNITPEMEESVTDVGQPLFAPEEEFEIIPEQVEDQIEGTPEAATISVMGQVFQMANEQSAAMGTAEGTLPLQTITNAWMNSGRDVDTLENAIIRYTNLSPEVAATLAQAISKQLEIQRGIAEVSNMASRKKEEEPEYRPFSFGKRIADELPAYMRNKMNKAYEVLRNEVSIEEANRVMQSMTVEEAMLATMKMDNGVPMAVRSMMAQITLRKIMDKRMSTKGKKRDEYRSAVEAHVDFIDWINEYLMEMGQGIQAFSRFSDLGADGILLKVRKDIGKAINKHITNRRKDIDKIKRDVEDGDSAAFDATLKANKSNIEKAADNAAKGEAKKLTIEEQAKKLAQRAAQRVAGQTVRRQTNPLSELVNGHLRKYNANFIAEAQALGVSPETAQKIEESAIKLRDARVAAKSERERFKAMQEERMRVKRELARENKYIYGYRPTIWEDYQSVFSERLARRLMRDPKKKIPPSLLLFTDRLTENLLGFVPEAERQASTPKSFQAMIEDALNNKERYQEAFNRALEDISLKIGELEVRMEAGEKLGDQYKKALAAQEFLERLAPQIQEFPVSDKLIMRFVGQKTKAANVSIVAKYNEWYRASRTQRKKLEQELAESLVSDVNISNADAVKLARSIVKDFVAKAEERREKALARFKKPKEKSKRLVESPLKKFFELVNMGAMTDQEAYEVMAHRFELPTWDEKFSEKIEKMALELQDMPEGNARRRMTQNLMAEIARKKGFSLADLGAGFAYSNMLSSTETFLVNLADTLVNNFTNGFADSVADGNWSRMKGIVRGYRKGWREAVYTFKTGLRINMPRLEEKTPLTVELVKYGKKGGVPLESAEGMNAIAKTILESYPAKVLNAWRYVTRIMEATDAFNYTASAEGQRYAEAAKIAKDEGLKGKAKDKRINEILNLGDDKYQAALKQAEQEGYTGPDAKLRAIEIQDSAIEPEMRERSFERALTDVYRNMPKGMAGMLAAKFDRTIMSFKNPWIRNALKLINAPFVITPTNLFNKWLDWSPYGYKRLFWGSGNFLDKEGPYYVAPPKVGSGEFYAQAFKASSSVLVMGMVGGLIKAGLLELIGRGPSDEEERKQWLDDGNKPYTFRFMNGPAISFVYSPWALMLSAMANISNWEKYNKKEDATFADRSYLAFLQTIGVVMELPFFSGPADLIDALIVQNNENFVRATNRFVESKYAMLFPNFVRQIDRILDPTVYDSEGIKGMIIDQVPFARRFGNQRLNMFGEPIGEDKPVADRLIGRFAVNPKPSRESRILAKYDAYPYMPNPRQAKALVDGEKAQMTEKQYDEFARGAGQEFKKWLNSNYDPDAEVDERSLERGKERIHKRLSEIRARWVRKVSTY